MTILHGDMRFYNNIFIQKEMRPALKQMMDGMKDNEWTDGNLIAGTISYEEYPTQEEYKAQFEGYCGMGSEPSDRYYNPLPVWAEGNVYFNGAKPMSKEKAFVDETNKVSVSLEETEEGFFLRTNLYDYMPEMQNEVITTDVLGMAFEPEQKFENPDGSPIVFNEDYFGKAACRTVCRTGYDENLIGVQSYFTYHENPDTMFSQYRGFLLGEKRRHGERKVSAYINRDWDGCYTPDRL